MHNHPINKSSKGQGIINPRDFRRVTPAKKSAVTTTGPSPPKCFIFHSRFDVAIYRYLVTNHRDEMEELKARDIKNFESLKSDSLGMRLTHFLSGSLAELFGEQSPIEVNPVDGAFFDDSDIFEELLSDAIARCDFVRIAEAYLAGVELPPYGAATSAEMSAAAT